MFETKNKFVDISELTKSNFPDYTNNIASEETNAILLSIEKANQEKLAAIKAGKNVSSTGVETSDKKTAYVNINKPWDTRLYRFIAESQTDEIPYNTIYGNTSTSDYYMTKESFDKLSDESKAKIEKTWDETIGKKIDKMKNDDFYKGVQSVVNPYALVTLYGSKGGSLLLDKKKQRAWYEVDTVESFSAGFSKIPTTQSLISWGNGDPYGRTPYQYSDFVFCKYWNKIPNNRLITLRRFPAPILDNMNFPGMLGSDTSGTGSSTSSPVFTPMATAVTYFGEETGNKLSEILKFKTGMPWSKTKGEVFNVNIQGGAADALNTVDDVYALGSILKHLNIWSGNWNFDSAMNQGAPPPDPWENGPWTNRVKGPINRIDEVAMRKEGIIFEMNNLKISFEYNAKPIGGINTKAAMLDILSNFLIIGSMNAMFFGGQHRFMSAPAQYPFPGGDKGLESWYSGNAAGFVDSTMTSFSTAGKDVFAGFKDILNKFLSAAKNFSFSDIAQQGKNLMNSLTDKPSDSGNMINNMQHGLMAAHTRKGVPYLLGMRALLIGEPVGEWHLTIGNPLNPIAMIGNLICKDIEIEFGDELGPDDFPMNVKITVVLENAMARDRDAIQSVFNRGMGRLYTLPDNMKGSADYQTRVDTATREHGVSGNVAVHNYNSVPMSNSGTVVGNAGGSIITKPSNDPSPSVWNRSNYILATNETNASMDIPSMSNRSVFRSLEWIGLAALK